eukprot:1183335-Prorocentrum_minimum.AAC.2
MPSTTWSLLGSDGGRTVCMVCRQVAPWPPSPGGLDDDSVCRPGASTPTTTTTTPAGAARGPRSENAHLLGAASPPPAAAWESPSRPNNLKRHFDTYATTAEPTSVADTSSRGKAPAVPPPGRMSYI